MDAPGCEGSLARWREAFGPVARGLLDEAPGEPRGDHRAREQAERDQRRHFGRRRHAVEAVGLAPRCYPIAVAHRGEDARAEPVGQDNPEQMDHEQREAELAEPYQW